MSIYHQVYSSDEDETLDNSTSPTSPNQPESVVNDLSDDDFVLAAESGNLEDFNRLFLAEPARLGVRDSKGRAAAHQAAARGKLNILQFIYSHGGDLNIQDHTGNTPLHIAVEHNSLEVVDYLLQMGVDTSVLNHKKQAALHLATELNRVSVLERMTRYKGIIDTKQGGEHGRTALHIAAILDHDECARILLISLSTFPADDEADISEDRPPIRPSSRLLLNVTRS
ncbi:Transient receptor putative cation channel sub A member 1, partial [Homalodisca vitripennis]